MSTFLELCPSCQCRRCEFCWIEEHGALDWDPSWDDLLLYNTPSWPTAALRGQLGRQARLPPEPAEPQSVIDPTSPGKCLDPGSIIYSTVEYDECEPPLPMPQNDRLGNVQFDDGQLHRADTIDTTSSQPTSIPLATAAITVTDLGQPKSPRTPAEPSLVSSPGATASTSSLDSPSGQILSQFLNHFYEWLQRRHGATEKSGGSPNSSDVGEPQQSIGNSGGPSSQKKRSASSEAKSRKGRSGPRVKSAKKAKTTGQLFACPFWKKDSIGYRSCYSGYTRINYVKQHLVRKHLRRSQCARCGDVFSTGSQLCDHHRASDGCQRREFVEVEGLSQDQRDSLGGYSTRNASPMDKWFAIWDIVFPGCTRPHSPYVDDRLSEDLSSYRQFCDTQGASILMSLAPHGSVQLSEIMFQDGFNTIFESWLSQRRLVEVERGLSAVGNSAVGSESCSAGPVTSSSNPPKPEDVAQDLIEDYSTFGEIHHDITTERIEDSAIQISNPYQLDPGDQPSFSPFLQFTFEDP